MYNLFSPQLGINTIPNFITARTAQGLRRAMLRNNTKHKGFVTYQDIQQLKDGTWIAWFYVSENIEGMTQLAGKDGNG